MQDVKNTLSLHGSSNLGQVGEVAHTELAERVHQADRRRVLSPVGPGGGGLSGAELIRRAGAGQRGRDRLARRGDHLHLHAF